MDIYIIVYSEYEGKGDIIGAFVYKSDAEKMIDYYVQEEGMPIEKLTLVKKRLTTYIM